MAINKETLGTGRKVLKKIFWVEAESVEAQYEWIVGQSGHTDQTHELYRQLKGFSMAAQTGDGNPISYEDLAPIYQLKLTPVLFTKGVKFTAQMKYTEQYGVVAGLMGQFARSFRHKKNQVAANMDNLGFTDTTYGVNSETLYATSHDMGGVTFSNRPTAASAFSPNAAKAALVNIRKQKSAQNEPMPYTKTVLCKLPPDLEDDGVEVIKSMLLANTANNNTNEFLRNRLEMKVCDYYSSATAHFYIARDEKVGTVLLEQMPFNIDRLERESEAGLYPWIGEESYQVGWYDPHWTYGDAGV